MPATTFKINDWVFSSFRLHQVREIDQNGVRQVSDGHFSRGGCDIRCFPVTMNGKLISAEFEAVHDLLHKEGGQLNLNFPAILDRLEQEWEITMRVQDDESSVKSQLDKLNAFKNDVLEAINVAYDQRIDGIPLFRPRSKR